MKFTSIYKRKETRYWYISYWSAKRGKRVHEATDFRIDDPTGRKKAYQYAQEKSTEAQAFKPLAESEVWSAWALNYIRERYRNSPLSFQRGKNAWAAVAEFLEINSIETPRAFEYLHVDAYLKWREQQTRHCGKLIARNTAITELKFLGVLMGEALRRGYTERNPCMRMGLKRDPAREKPEMTDQEIATIRRLLAELIAREPGKAWMSICFEIAIHQGCRLSETSVPLNWIDVVRRTITFRAKGGKVFTTALHHGLVPLINRLKQENRLLTYERPQLASKDWHFFFKDNQMPHLCFHCTRVTVITRLARAGVSQSQAMRFVGHASETVHRIYQRLNASDLQACLDAIPA